jgi:hypothetical protein
MKVDGLHERLDDGGASLILPEFPFFAYPNKTLFTERCETV